MAENAKRRNREASEAFEGPEETVAAEETLYTAGQVFKMLGVTERTLRLYDQKGLLCPRRTGEDVANNRKLYSEDDLDRLGRILILKEYGFTLSEIAAVIDLEEDEVAGAFDFMLKRLRRKETRMRNLILFVDYAHVTDSDLFDCLLYGPEELDELAEAARQLPPYERGSRWLDNAEEGEVALALASLDGIMDEFMLGGAEADIHFWENFADKVALWWDMNLYPYDELGFLGWYALFEDQPLIAAHIEEAANGGFRKGENGGEGLAGFVEMALFWVFLKRLMEATGTFICQIQRIYDERGEDEFIDEEVLEAAYATARIIAVLSGGGWWNGGADEEGGAGKPESNEAECAAGAAEDATENTDSAEAAYGIEDIYERNREDPRVDDFATLCIMMIEYMESAAANERVMKFLDPHGVITVSKTSLDATKQAVALCAYYGAGLRNCPTWIVPDPASECRKCEGPDARS